MAQGVHTVLPGGGVRLPRFGRRNGAGRRKSGFSLLDAEVASPHLPTAVLVKMRRRSVSGPSGRIHGSLIATGR